MMRMESAASLHGVLSPLSPVEYGDQPCLLLAQGAAALTAWGDRVRAGAYREPELAWAFTRATPPWVL